MQMSQGKNLILTTLNTTFFIKKSKHEILHVQIHVDDIIFDSILNESLCKDFFYMMQNEFEISMMESFDIFSICKFINQRNAISSIKLSILRSFKKNHNGKRQTYLNY